jgi:hypothetical protein
MASSTVPLHSGHPNTLWTQHTELRQHSYFTRTANETSTSHLSLGPKALSQYLVTKSDYEKKKIIYEN